MVIGSGNTLQTQTFGSSVFLCEIGSGITTSFWQDNWSSIGPLIDITGPSGPRRYGIPIDAVVSDAIINGRWWIDGTKSRNPIISLLRQCLPSPTPIAQSESDDCFKWKIGIYGLPKNFSASETWRALHPHGQSVGWFKAVWFKGIIPKHSLLCWVTARNRMHTRDRLMSWGLPVSPRCLLCDVEDETRQHIFFDCPFSHEILYVFYSTPHLSPPTNFNQCLLWLLSPSRDANIPLIIRLTFQAYLYGIWRKRNARLHSSTSTPASLLSKVSNKRSVIDSIH